MASKKLISGLTALAIGFSPASQALANAGDFVAGAIIGGVIGSAVTQQNQKKRRAVVRSSHEGREIQTSLNYFGFNAGYVDGALGQRSRNAISSYQAYMGYTPTGYLNPFEQNILITSYQRAMVGGYGVNQVISTSPDGRRGLLIAYREEITGGSGQGTTFATTQPKPVEEQAEEQTTTTSTSTLPSFLGAAQQQSLASHCNKVSLLTNSNGGFTQASAISDANFALNEQFCLARTYAIANGEELISSVQGVTPAQIAQQCEAFGPALKEHVAALSLQPMDEVVRQVSGFVLSTGMSPAQLSGTAKICLSVGYRTDNMDVAIGSGLLLFAVGEKVYGELMGHHLSQGFGASKRIDLAMDWYAAGLEAAENGATAAFAPGQPDRYELIRAAAYQVSSGSSSVSAPEKPQSASLPVFKVDN